MSTTGLIAEGFDEYEPEPLSLEEIRDIVRQVGLQEAVEVYVSHTSIDNPELAKWWELAERSLRNIRKILIG